MDAEYFGTPVLAATHGTAHHPHDAVERAWKYLTALRGRRVVLLLVGVWILNVFDLTMTMRASADGMLNEENPIARTLLRLGPPALTTFKLAILCGASYVLVSFRQRRCAEVACGVVLIAYAGVALQWKYCYEMYELCCIAPPNNDAFITVDRLLHLIPTL